MPRGEKTNAPPCVRGQPRNPFVFSHLKNTGGGRCISRLGCLGCWRGHGRKTTALEGVRLAPTNHKGSKNQRSTKAKASPVAVAPPSGFAAYFQESKDPYNAILLVLPLFVLYQLGVLGAGGVRNGVDFMTDILINVVKVAFTLFGSPDADGTIRASNSEVLVGYVVANLVIGVGLAGVVWALRDKGTFRPKIWPWVLLESLIYAIFFGAAVNGLMRLSGLSGLLAISGPSLATGGEGMNPFQAFIMSIGAGLYEEIVFRLLLMSGLFWVLHKKINLGSIVAAVVAVLVSSIIFSAVHHIGALGDPFTLSVFLFRFFAGVLLAAIFSVRGFAVAVYTHAIYDVIILVLKGGG